MSKIAVGYVRVSTDRQVEEGASIEDQKNQIAAYCSSKGLTLSGFYEEPGETATEDKRPELRRLLEDAGSRERPFDFVVVYHSSRFFRNNFKRAWAEHKLEERGVRVVSVTQRFEGNESEVKFLKNVLGSIDEYQSANNADNTIRCMRENARQGYCNGAVPLYGYQKVETEKRARTGFKKVLVICPEEAEVVRKIFFWAVNGIDGRVAGMQVIARELHSRGLTKRGRRWTTQRIHEVLRNSTYDGTRVTFIWNTRKKCERPEEERIRAPVPRIVEHELWAEAQKALSARRLCKPEAKAEQAPSLLTGLIVCGLCGAKFAVMTGKSGQYSYYRCSARTTTSCPCPNIPKAILDAAVTHALASTLLTPAEFVSVVQSVWDLSGKHRKQIQQGILLVQRQRASIQEKLAQLYGNVAEGKLVVDGFLKQMLDSYEQQLGALESEIRELETHRELPLRKVGTDHAVAFANAARKALGQPDSPYAKAFVRAVATRIEIYPEKFTLSAGRLGLAAAAASWTGKAPSLSVPSFASRWRPGPELNRRPTA